MKKQLYQLGMIYATKEQVTQLVTAAATLHYEPHVIEQASELEAPQTCRYDGFFISEREGISSEEICRIVLLLKKQFNGYIWLISNQTSKVNRLVYLELGVDGIYSEEELLLVLKNAMKRESWLLAKHTENQEVPPASQKIWLNDDNYSVLISDKNKQKEIQLTRLEYQAVALLFTRPGSAFSYQEIYEKIWHIEYNNNASRVANLIFHIRMKLEKNASNPQFIQNVRSKGYKLKLS